MLAAAIFTLAGCPTDGGGGGSSGSEVTYIGKAGDDTYKLTITKAAAGKAAYTPQPGDDYVLIFGNKESRGKVISFSSLEFTLQPSVSGSVADEFKVTVNADGGLTRITGEITLVNGNTETPPSEITPETPGNDNVSTNGKLTVTGIPSEYNGSYVIAMLGSDREGLKLGAVEGIIDLSQQKVTAARISNGTATLKVYKAVGEDISSVTAYAGNDTLSIIVEIVSGSNVTIGGGAIADNLIAYTENTTVTFRNGIGTVSVAGVGFISYGGNGGNVPTNNGSLTITGIPAVYNGKYIVAIPGYETGSEVVVAVDSINAAGNLIAARITNGSATLKVYRATEIGDNFSNIAVYSGSETLSLAVGVFSTSTVISNSNGPPAGLIAMSTVTVTFTNGKGSGSVAGSTFDTEPN
jgi:hypothetical protein